MVAARGLNLALIVIADDSALIEECDRRRVDFGKTQLSVRLFFHVGAGCRGCPMFDHARRAELFARRAVSAATGIVDLVVVAAVSVNDGNGVVVGCVYLGRELVAELVYLPAGIGVPSGSDVVIAVGEPFGGVGEGDDAV